MQKQIKLENKQTTIFIADNKLSGAAYNYCSQYILLYFITNKTIKIAKFIPNNKYKY